jgi:hypothetical protein
MITPKPKTPTDLIKLLSQESEYWQKSADQEANPAKKKEDLRTADILFVAAELLSFYDWELNVPMKIG